MALLALRAFPAFAANVELKVDNADVALGPDTLEQAAKEANASGVAGGRYGTTIDIGLSGNQIVDAGNGGVAPLYFFHGVDIDSSATPATLPLLGGGFKSVSIQSATDQYIQIGFSSTDATNRSRVLEIINVGESISLTGIEVVNGYLTEASDDTYLGGGGLYLGAASGTTKYPTIPNYPGPFDPGANGMFAKTITLNYVNVANNTVELFIDDVDGNQMRAAIGGGAFVDATNYDDGKAGGKVVFANVNFTENSVSVTSDSAKGTGSSAFGGGVRVKNATEFSYTNGTIEKNTATTNYGSHAAGGGIAIDDFTHVAELKNLTITGNTAEAKGYGYADGGVAKALGGGLYTRHDGTEGKHLVLTVTGVTFEGNKASAEGTNVDAYGGGAFLNEGSKGTFSGNGFKDNRAESKDGNAWGGGLAQTSTHELSLGSMAFIGNKSIGALHALGGGVYSLGELKIDGVGFSENAAFGQTALGGGIYAKSALELKNNTIFSKNTVGIGEAPDDVTPAPVSDIGRGAGVYAEGTVDVDTVAFRDNVATGTVTAQGGGVYAQGEMTSQKSEYSGNTVESDIAEGGGVYAEDDSSFTDDYIGKNTVIGGSLGQGGGIYGGGKITAESSEISQNTVSGESAAGGGVFADGESAFDKTILTGNSVTGHSDVSNPTTALGGGLYGVGKVELSGGGVIGNTAKGDTAHGGGIYAGGDVDLTDTAVRNNTADGADAAGAGIYMDLDSSDGTLTLKATDGNSVTISGNKAGLTGDPDSWSASGVHFGGGAANNGSLVVESLGTVNLLDPVSVEIGGAFVFTRTGTGTLNWGGANTFDATGGTIINLDQGTNYLTADFSATAVGGTDFEVNLGGLLGFDSNRDSDQAIFDFGVGGNDTLTLGAGLEFAINTSSELFGDTKTYLLGDNFSDVVGIYDEMFGEDRYIINQDGEKVWLTVEYKSLYQNLINSADPNTASAVSSGALTDPFKNLTDQERASLTSSQAAFNSATPGWYMNSLHSGMETLLSGAETARKFGLGTARQFGRAPAFSGDAWASPADVRAHTGARFWSGYIGDFNTVDPEKGYFGYKSTRHGFVAGFNFDSSQVGSIGIYGGYTHTKLEGKGAIISDVKSDAGHAGIIGRLSPLREVEQFSLSADAGYTFSSNRGKRGAGASATSADYDQKYYTVGLEAEYAINFGNGFLVPYASARYVRIQQDGFEEKGLLANHVDNFDDNTWTTKVGLTFGGDIQTGFGVVTPSVSAAWRHDFGDGQYSSNAHFQGAVNPIVYRVQSVKMDKDSFDVGAAIRARLNAGGEKPFNVNLGYNLNTGGSQKNHSVYVGFDLGF